MRRRCTIIKCVCERFRVPFYERLGDILGEGGVDLRVLYGQPAVPERGLVEGPFRYGERMRNVYIPVLHKRLILHTGVRQALTESDLVVVQQGNTLLLNYALIALRGVMGFRLAFWGHGKNFQTSPGRLAEKWKRIYSRFADHWFAYNDLSKRVVTGFGFPEDKITSVGNTIDIDAAVAESDSIGESELSALRNELGIQIDAPVGICCSRLYEAKGLPFLFRSMEKVRAEIPEFHLIVVGDGPFREVVAAYAGRNPSWVHWVGPAYGRRKALYFKVSDFQLLPGIVGLNVVDSFANARPLITTNTEGHGPEIAYLVPGVNGMITENTEDCYARSVTNLIRSPKVLAAMQRECRAARSRLTVDHMAANFAQGVFLALSVN